MSKRSSIKLTVRSVASMYTASSGKTPCIPAESAQCNSPQAQAAR
jgi:hypothetical protein